MKHGSQPVELTEAELASRRPQGTIVAVRIFKSPYHWYAGKLSEIWIEGDGSCHISLEQQVYFERMNGADPDVLGTTLVDNMTDRPARSGHAVTVPQFVLAKPRSRERVPEGVLCIAYEGGTAFLSIRGQDVIAVTRLLQRAAATLSAKMEI